MALEYRKIYTRWAPELKRKKGRRLMQIAPYVIDVSERWKRRKKKKGKK